MRYLILNGLIFGDVWILTALFFSKDNCGLANGRTPDHWKGISHQKKTVPKGRGDAWLVSHNECDPWICRRAGEWLTLDLACGSVKVILCLDVSALPASIFRSSWILFFFFVCLPDVWALTHYTGRQEAVWTGNIGDGSVYLRPLNYHLTRQELPVGPWADASSFWK